jgi:hypothetical protein
VSITQERLKEVLDYNIDTGMFTWKEEHNPKIRDHLMAGTTRKDGYVLIGIDKKRYYSHRLAWLYITGKNGNIIDHVDMNPSNNSFNNLRNTTMTGNSRNRQKPRSDNQSSSDTPGVAFNKNNNSWRVRIKLNKKTIEGGSYKDYSVAKLVCLSLRREHFKENTL